VALGAAMPLQVAVTEPPAATLDGVTLRLEAPPPVTVKELLVARRV